MKVRDVMTRRVRACGRADTISAAVDAMRQEDCGILPVVDADGAIRSVVTDRDVCLAAGGSGRPASAMTVSEACSARVLSCKPGDEIAEALEIMKTGRVRRLPVIDAQGRLQGILSLDDVVMRAGETKDGNLPDISFADIVGTLKKVVARRPRALLTAPKKRAVIEAR